MAEIGSEFIKRGFWVDWSKGRTLGATITTDAVSGNVIIALLAILVSLATDHLWNLILFTIHQSRAARAAGHTTFQQEQAILRTLPTPFLLVTDVVKLAWAWQTSKTSRYTRRMLVIALLTITFGIASLAAGIFTSYIVETADLRVLVTPGQCVTNINPSLAMTGPDWVSPLARTGQLYADNCYTTNSTPTGCNVFVQPRIPFTQTTVDCPFTNSSLCIGPDQKAIAFDTGLLDSNDIFGLNDKPGNRIMLRKRTTYAPVQVEGYFKRLSTDEYAPFIIARQPLPGEDGFAFEYGSNNLAGPGQYTWLHNAYIGNTSLEYTAYPAVNYSYEPDLAGFTVIPDFYVPDADIALMFVASNHVLSRTPIDDPVFSAHLGVYCQPPGFVNCTNTPSPDRNSTWYHSDYPAGVVAAIQQYQACTVDSSGKPSECTELMGSMFARAADLLPSANQQQRVTFDFMSTVTSLFDLGDMQLVSVVQAQRKAVGGTTTGLPEDQWTIEARGWESLVWAVIQNIIASHATGFSAQQTTGLLSPSNSAESHFCASQKVLKTGGFANINVFGLCFAVVVAAVLIIADVFILRYIVFLSRGSRFLAPRIHSWIQDGVLQLQRRAYEADGVGPWERVEEEFPILEDYKEIPTLYAPHSQARPEQTSLSFSNPFDRTAYEKSAPMTWTSQATDRALSSTQSDTSATISSPVFSNTIEDGRGEGLIR